MEPLFIGSGNQIESSSTGIFRAVRARSDAQEIFAVFVVVHSRPRILLAFSLAFLKITQRFVSKFNWMAL
jgi:hypothetical protein